MHVDHESLSYINKQKCLNISNKCRWRKIRTVPQFFFVRHSIKVLFIRCYRHTFYLWLIRNSRELRTVMHVCVWRAKFSDNRLRWINIFKKKRIQWMSKWSLCKRWKVAYARATFTIPIKWLSIAYEKRNKLFQLRFVTLLFNGQHQKDLNVGRMLSEYARTEMLPFQDHTANTIAEEWMNSRIKKK